MPARFLWPLVVVFSASPIAAYSQGSSDATRQLPTWRFEIANDVVFDTDNQFTNGFSFQKHSAHADQLEDLEGVAGFGRSIASRVLPSWDGVHYRKGLRVGQNMATPNDLENPDLILDDVPYHGFLGAESSWIAFDDDRFRGYATTFGLVGEYSGAEAMQKAVHSLIDSTDPEGWDNQLDHEPVLNVFAIFKRKFVNRPSFDAAWTVDLAAGNYHTGIEAGVEMRFGRKPDGFTYTTSPLGKGMSYDGTLGRTDGRSEAYFSLAARAWAWALFLPLEGNQLVSGNEWTDNNTIDPEHVVGQVIGGFHYVRPKWGFHMTFHIQTDNIDEDSIANGASIDNDFGFLMFEYRFGD